MRWAGHVARMGEMRNAYKILAVKPEGKRTFGRRRSRWEDGIGMYEGVSKSSRTGRLELELQMVQLSATKCSCIAIL